MAEKTVPQVLTMISEGQLFRPGTASTYASLRKLRMDPTVTLARQLSIAPILSSAWAVEATEDAPEGAKEYIDKQIQPFRSHILRKGFLGCIDFGWQAFEKIFEIKDGKVGIAKLKQLLPDITDIMVNEKTGAYTGLKQDIVSLRVEDTLLLYLDVEGTDWYGQSVLEIVKSIQEQWLVVNAASERYDRKVAGSHWVIHYPPGKSMVDGVETDNFTVAQTLLSTLEASGAIAVPRQVGDLVDDLNKDTPDAWTIALLSDSGQSRAAFIDRQKYLDALKVRAFGLPERAVLEGEFGTKAEAEAHADFAITNMEIRHQNMVQLVNWHVVNQLLRLNWGEQYENTVFIEPAPITDLALQYLRDVYTAVLGNPDGFAVEVERIDMNALKRKLAVPILEEEDVEPLDDSSEDFLSSVLRRQNGHFSNS